MTSQRLANVVEQMKQRGIDALALSYGFDLPWLSGYLAMPLERLTMLVVRSDGASSLVVPALEAPRVESRDYFEIIGWDDSQDPIGLVASLIGNARSVAISDQAWATTLHQLQSKLPSVEWSMSSALLGPLRAKKDAEEIRLLEQAGAAADRVASQIQDGQVVFVGRTEHEVSEEIGRRLIEEGHQSVDFVIVASGANGASPHHEPGSHRIAPNDVIVCDFGGTFDGYCSDTTRTFFTGSPSAKQREVYEVVRNAQQAGFEAAVAGTAASEIDAAARKVIDDAGYGEYFIHRVGHGIGVETHEAPYLVSTNSSMLEVGNAFSIEPGIYIPGHFGVRIEDIVVSTDSGPKRLNNSSRDLCIVG